MLGPRRALPRSSPATSRRRFTGAEHAAVDGVTLAVTPGEVLALLGPSGCGKTTTLRMLAGLERPDRGEIEIGGRTVFGHGVWVPPELRSVGMVFQDYALFPHLTVAGNIALRAQQAVDATSGASESRRCWP